MPDDQSNVAVQEPPSVAVKPAAPRPSRKPEQKQLPPYNVVLLDDDDHSYQYVIKMLGQLFAHPLERAYKMAKEVDSSGRVIVLTTHKEQAELKRDQIHAFGAGVLMGARSKGVDVSSDRARDGPVGNKKNRAQRLGRGENCRLSSTYRYRRSG